MVKFESRLMRFLHIALGVIISFQLTSGSSFVGMSRCELVLREDIAKLVTEKGLKVNLVPDHCFIRPFNLNKTSIIIHKSSDDKLNSVANLLKDNTGKEIRLLHYAGSDINSAKLTSFSVDCPEKVLTYIDFAKPLALYIHGFRESPANESIRTVADAYLRRGDRNFILVDWSDYAYDNYLSALFHVKRIATSIAKVLNGFVEESLPSEGLHIVGHSMGAQMAGFIGKYTNFEVPRITGLDPASPGYYKFGADHLNNESAKFVDVIHTDGGLYGAYPTTGTVDCYPNGGIRPQPGCPLLGVPLSPTDLCSHWRSWRFWAESLLNERVFLAVKCGSYDLFLNGKCSENEAEYCGFIMRDATRGKYYFSTNAESPFGRKERGLRSN